MEEANAESRMAREGEAKIKAEFLIVDDLVETAIGEESNEKGMRKANCDRNDDEPKRKKLKGQNKHRPRDARQPKREKLCPVIVAGNECSYGIKCHFTHDVGEYVERKPVDIGSECYLFKTFGKCHYGLTCRFSSVHTTPEFENVVNEELWKKWRETDQLPRNNLSKELQMKLRKKNYDFKPANESVDNILKAMSNERKQENGNCGLKQNEVPTMTPSEPTESNKRLDFHQERVEILGNILDEELIKLRPSEIKRIDFNNLLYLSPLTTVGNLPFRRICKRFGADVTCGEMAVSLNLLQGQQSEWALVKRHTTETVFGVQLSGAHADIMAKCSQLLKENCSLDFIDINVGCPIDIIYQKGAGCALMNRTKKFEEIVRSMKSILQIPLTVKLRTGVYENKNTAHILIPKLKNYGVNLVSIHGRSREQRYTKFADWTYIDECARLAAPMPVFGNGDILSYEDYYDRLHNTSVSGVLIGRGALLKPWIFTEIKERRHWDISSHERFEILRDFVNYGLEHWGSDSEGVQKTRRFLLEWLSFLHRYIPVGLLERLPQRINERPPKYKGRNDLETLMASSNCSHWIKISEMLLGPVPSDFVFLPKHKANSYR